MTAAAFASPLSLPSRLSFYSVLFISTSAFVLYSSVFGCRNITEDVQHLLFCIHLFKGFLWFINMGLIFIDVTIIPISQDNIVLTKLIAEIWEHGNIHKNKSETQVHR